MKLRNKKTREIADYKNFEYDLLSTYNSLAELNEEWEDYEDPKEFWFIADYGLMCGHKSETTNLDYAFYSEKDIQKMQQIGNYFKTKEEAEKAVEELKAWKRLKDKGFRFDGWSAGLGKNKIYTIFWSHNDGEFDLRKDLDLLFGVK